jgi:hypothetical protein
MTATDMTHINNDVAPVKTIDLTEVGTVLKLWRPNKSGVKDCWKIKFDNGAIFYAPDDMFDRLVVTLPSGVEPE